MIRALKQRIKRLLAKFGLVIFKRSTGIYLGEEEIPALALKLCAKSAPLVIDGGAHTGAFVSSIRATCPNARFLCFEPDPFLASSFRVRYSGDENVHLIQSALGAECGKAIFNINRSRATNSLSNVTSATTGLLNELTTTVERIDVSVTSIDETMRENSLPTCDIIKLDLQGHDLPALKGAQTTLKSTKVVIVEVWFAAIYTPNATFLEVCAFMRERGFELYSLAGLHYGTNNRLLWSDAIFVRSDAEALDAPVTIN